MIAANGWRRLGVDAAQPNPNAMVLATVDDRGHPSARVVLCKDINARPATSSFTPTMIAQGPGTRRQSPGRGGISLGSSAPPGARRRPGRTALGRRERRVFSHPGLAEPPRRLGQRTKPARGIASALADSVAAAARRFGIPYGGPGAPGPDNVTVDVPRPPHWGGFRLYREAVELWVEGEFRIHDRARWTRDRRAAPPQTAAAAAPPPLLWTATRLQP